MNSIEIENKLLKEENEKLRKWFFIGSPMIIRNPRNTKPILQVLCFALFQEFL